MHPDTYIRGTASTAAAGGLLLAAVLKTVSPTPESWFSTFLQGTLVLGEFVLAGWLIASFASTASIRGAAGFFGVSAVVSAFRLWLAPSEGCGCFGDWDVDRRLVLLLAVVGTISLGAVGFGMRSGFLRWVGRIATPIFASSVLMLPIAITGNAKPQAGGRPNWSRS
jgi:hypothetical protein